MYQLPHFTEQDRNKIIGFIRENPFATIVGCEGYESVATQVPLLIDDNDEELVIRGHIMRDTDHYEAFANNRNVLLLFTGPSCYVSSSWYSERGHGSTWNYMTVHARGVMQFLKEEETIDLLSELTEKYERREVNPVLLKDMSGEYIHSLAKHIAGFNIRISALYPIFKLSQNKDDQSYINIVKQLETKTDYNSREIARQMKSSRKHLFD